MSFGYSVGDFLAILQLAKHIVDACRDGPSEFRELNREIQSFEIVIQRISTDAKNPQSRLNRKGTARKKDFDQIVENCKITMEEIRKFVDKHSAIDRSDGGAAGAVRRVWNSYQVGSEDLNNMRGKLIFWISCINSFLNSLDPAAQTRIEHKLDLLMEKLGLASLDAGVSNNSVASVSSVFTFHGGSPDEDSWNLIQRGLLAEGVAESDIDDNKEKIIQYVKDLVIGSLPTSSMENSIHNATSATQAWTKSIVQRRNFIAKLDQYSLYSQQLRKSSIDFKIQRIQHGTVYSEPASSISFDIWLRPEHSPADEMNYRPEHSPPNEMNYRSGRSPDVETDIRLRVSSESSEAASNPNDPPIIVKLSPTWMRKIDKPRRSVELGIPIVGEAVAGAYNPKIFEGESMERSEITDWSVRAISSPKDRKTIRWHIRKFMDPFSSKSSLHVRMAVIVEHGNRPFSLEVELSQSRKSRLQNLAIFRERPSVNKIEIIPETGSGLEEVDLDQRKYMVDPLLEVQNVGEGKEVGLEYDGKAFYNAVKL
jgi:archaellum component FlaF (FlaF/FlaG flagellin family)